MNINWLVRVKNKTFWLPIISTLWSVVQILTSWFGIKLQLI
ncbi:phage holin [Paraliobacillus ryukyuensis]